MLQNKINKEYIFLTIFTLVIFSLIFINCDDKDFFDMDLYEILTIGLLVFVSFYLVEKNSDRRSMIVKIEETISIIKIELNKINISLFDESFECRKYTVISKKISNKIALLEHYSKKINIQEEVLYIKKITIEIDDMVGNHIEDTNVLKSILVDIENKKDQIDVRFDNIFKKMY